MTNIKIVFGVMYAAVLGLLVAFLSILGALVVVFTTGFFAISGGLLIIVYALYRSTKKILRK